MSKLVNVQFSFICIDLNHSITPTQFFQSVKYTFSLCLPFMPSRICLLTNPFLLFAGLMSLHCTLFSNFFVVLQCYECLTLGHHIHFVSNAKFAGSNLCLCIDLIISVFTCRLVVPCYVLSQQLLVLCISFSYYAKDVVIIYTHTHTNTHTHTHTYIYICVH